MCSYEKYLYKTSLNPPLVSEVRVPTKENERACICV